LNHLIATVQIQAMTEKTIKQRVEEIFGTVNHDPDDYMASGCSDGFCPMPSVRQGPSEDLFRPVN